MSGCILVVDDLPQNIRLLEAVLEPEGYEVIAASSGPNALEHTGVIDLVLLDVMMPGMDGYSVCRHVREVTQRPSSRDDPRQQ